MSKDRAVLSRLCQIEEDDDRRVADWGIMPGELQTAFRLVHAEDRDVVAALVARVEELAGGIEIDAARVVPARPFLAHEGQRAVFPHGENADAVMEAVARIDETPIGGNQNLGAKITTGKSRWQAGDCLPRRQPSVGGIVIEQDEVRAFLLNGIEPASIGVEVQMPRPVSGRQ